MRSARTRVLKQTTNESLKTSCQSHRERRRPSWMVAVKLADTSNAPLLRADLVGEYEWVSINNVLASVTQFPLPMAGWRESGIGSRSGGAEGIRKYCRAKSIVAERVTMKKEPNWYPYSRTKRQDGVGRGQVPRSSRLETPTRSLTSLSRPSACVAKGTRYESLKTSYGRRRGDMTDIADQR